MAPEVVSTRLRRRQLSCVANKKRRDPVHGADLVTTGQNKERSTERDMQAHNGERTRRVGHKMLG